MDYQLLSNGLLGLIAILLGIIAYFLKQSYQSLLRNQDVLFERDNGLDRRVTALETACEIRHGGK